MSTISHPFGVNEALRTVKPPVKPSRPATQLSRDYTRSTFRILPLENVFIVSTRPRTPHLSWMGLKHQLFGLNDEVLPPDLDLNSPRVGRTFVYSAKMKSFTGSFELETMKIAIFPACPSIPLVPPFPGVPDDHHDIPNSTASSYIDGNRGAFDSRHIPQLWNKRKPWLGFNDNPSSLDWGSETCELSSPVDYFHWNQPGNPSRGGAWIKSRLAVLFSKRENVEDIFRRSLNDLFQLHQPLARFTDARSWQDEFDLPWWDPINWRDAITWRTWSEGRDRLAHTLQYVAELKAVNRWLQTTMDISEIDRTAPIPPPNPGLMGVWAATINTTEDWEFLRYCRVPVYVITRIPDSHHLSACATPGNPDGDERFRRNAFDAEHDLTPYWFRHDTCTPMVMPDLHLQCRSEYLPTSLSPVIPPPSRNPNAQSNSHLLTWHSPVYLDPVVTRSFTTENIEDRRTLDKQFPITSSHLHVLKAGSDRHPILDLIGSKAAKDGKITRYEEIYDDDLDGYYPQRLGHSTPATRERLNSVDYIWHYPAENIQILSDFPCPGRSLSFGRREPGDDDDEETELTHLKSSRRYFTASAIRERNGEDAFIWEPVLEHGVVDRRAVRIRAVGAVDGTNSVFPYPRIDHQQIYVLDDPVYDAVQQGHLSADFTDIIIQPQPVPVFSDYVDAIVPSQPLPQEDPAILQWRCNYVAMRGYGDVATTVSEALVNSTAADIERKFHILRRQRDCLHAQIRRRLFKPALGDAAVSPRAVPWHIVDGPSNAICYPIRISGIHGDASERDIFALLDQIFDIRWHEIVLFASCTEMDTTRSIELGLRFCEDAMHVRLGLHGVLVDDRLLEVQYLRAMSMKVQAVSYPLTLPPDQQRSSKIRLRRIVAIKAIPGLDAESTGHAWELERDYARFLAESHAHSAETIDVWKHEMQQPMRSLLTHLDSLLVRGDRAPYYEAWGVAQQVSLGPLKVPPLPGRVFCYVAMTDGIRWAKSPVENATRKTSTGNAAKNNKKHNKIPALAFSSKQSSGQRQALRRAIEHHASFVQGTWRPADLQLPRLQLTAADNATSPENATVRMFQELWDWQDKCMLVMRQFRAQDVLGQYDYSSFEMVFGELARLDAIRGIRGSHYPVLSKALRKRQAACAIDLTED